MKKSFLILAVAAIGMMASCEKNGTYAGQQNEESGQVPVVFSLKSTDISVRSNGTVGSVDPDQNHWNGEELYILGYDRSVNDFTQPAFIDNVMAQAPMGTASGSIEVENPDYNEPFYYGNSAVYDFYGYYIDDATVDGLAPEPVKEQNRVYVPFVLNGGQDLMIAKADPAVDVASAGTGVDASRAYSAYAARRNVNPSLTFKHMLTRFTFEIVAGAASADLVTVQSLAVRSKYKGNLVVAGESRGLADVEEIAGEDPASLLYLQEKSGDGQTLQALTPLKANTYQESDGVADLSNTKQIGESIMVIPGESKYEMILATKHDTNATIPEPLTVDLDYSKLVGTSGDAVAFEAGKSYKITIVIYGPEEVKISATLEKWEEGGSQVINPEEMF